MKDGTGVIEQNKRIDGECALAPPAPAWGARGAACRGIGGWTLLLKNIMKLLDDRVSRKPVTC